MLAKYMLSSCVCLSYAGIVPKWLNIRSCKQRHTIAQGPFSEVVKISSEIQTESPLTITPNRGADCSRLKSAIFYLYLAISQINN